MPTLVDEHDIRSCSLLKDFNGELVPNQFDRNADCLFTEIGDGVEAYRNAAAEEFEIDDIMLAMCGEEREAGGGAGGAGRRCQSALFFLFLFLMSVCLILSLSVYL